MSTLQPVQPVQSVQPIQPPVQPPVQPPNVMKLAFLFIALILAGVGVFLLFKKKEEPPPASGSTPTGSTPTGSTPTGSTPTGTLACPYELPSKRKIDMCDQNTYWFYSKWMGFYLHNDGGTAGLIYAGITNAMGNSGMSVKKGSNTGTYKIIQRSGILFGMQLVAYQLNRYNNENRTTPSDSDVDTNALLVPAWVKIDATESIVGKISKDNLITEWKFVTDTTDPLYFKIQVPDSTTTGKNVSFAKNKDLCKNEHTWTRDAPEMMQCMKDTDGRCTEKYPYYSFLVIDTEQARKESWVKILPGSNLFVWGHSSWLK